MKYITLLLLFSGFLQAGSITQVEIEESVVYFSTLDMPESQLSCTDMTYKKTRSISLKTSTGRAQYSLIVTALAKGHDISVVSAGDCADKLGIERAEKLSLMPQGAPPTSVASSVGLYKGDGVRIGTLINATYTNGMYTYDYITKENALNYEQLQISDNYSIFFDESNCKGKRLTSGGISYYDNQFWTGSSDNNASFRALSVYSRGRCTAQHWSQQDKLYRLAVKIAHPVCGFKRCVIKED